MNHARRLSAAAVVGAMGIVYGDIGTSPLYTLESALAAAGPFNAEAVLGVLSLIFWALTISVTHQVPDHHHERRQRGRGWHPRAVRARAAPPDHRQPLEQDRGGTRARRHGVLLLRRSHHAGDLGAGRGRGPGGAQSRPAEVCGPGDRRGARGAVRLPAPRHGARRAALRPRDARLVHRDRRPRRDAHRPPSRGARGAQPAEGPGTALTPPAGCAGHHRRGVPRHHGR